MESNTNEALFLPSVSGVPNPQSAALFASRHAAHTSLPVSISTSLAVVGDSLPNCPIRTPPSCKRKSSSALSPSKDRPVDAASNGSPSQSDCRPALIKDTGQFSASAKRPCLNNSVASGLQPAIPQTSVSSTSGGCSLTVTNSAPAANASGHDGTDVPFLPPPESTQTQSTTAQEAERNNTGKLDEIIEYVLDLARSDDPHEDVFVLPARTREFVPLPSPINQGSTPSSSLNTSPPASPSSSPRLISPAFSNSNIPSNSLFIPTHPFQRCGQVEQLPAGVQQRSLICGNGPTAAASVIEVQRDKHRLQVMRENHAQLPTTVTMLMKTSIPESYDSTSFMVPKVVDSSGYSDLSGLASQHAVYNSRQIKLPNALTETKVAASIVPVQPDPQKQSVSQQQQQFQQSPQQLQPRLVAYIPQRQIYDSANPVFTVPSTVQPRLNISTNSLAIKKDQTVEIINQVNFPHGSVVTNGVAQVNPGAKQPVMTPFHHMQYVDLSMKPASGPAAARKRPPASSKRKKSNSGQPPAMQCPKMPTQMGSVAGMRVPAVGSPVTEFTQQHQPQARQTVAGQDILNKLRIFDPKCFLSDPAMEAFASALPPLPYPMTPALVPAADDECWLSNVGAKYRRSGMALKTIPRTQDSSLSDGIPDVYLSQRLPQPISRPTMQGTCYNVNMSENHARICPSPKPVTLENRMQSLYSSLRQPESPEGKTNNRPSEAGLVTTSADLQFSLLQMLKTPCSPRENPSDRKTPPLPLCHIPNTELLKAPSQRRIVGEVANALIDCETGEVVGARREPAPLLNAKLKSCEEKWARVVYSINPTQPHDVPGLLRYLCELLKIDLSCVSYTMSITGGEISVHSGRASLPEAVLRQFESKLRGYFFPLSVRVEPATTAEKVESNGEVSDQMKLLAELQKEKPDESSGQPISPPKHKEEPISIASIQSTKKLPDDHCRTCNAVVLACSGIRRKMEEISGAPAAPLTIDHGYHCSDVLVFCGDECLHKFISFISSCLPPNFSAQTNNSCAADQAVPSVEQPRQHNQQLVFGSLPSANPVLLQHLPSKSLKLHTLLRRNSSLTVGKRKGSPKQKRWRDHRWRMYRADFHHARKFATAPQVPSERETQHAERCRTTIRDNTIPDTRPCILCNSKGDASVTSAERILCLGLDRWIHLNCALWCYDIYESVSGSLHRVDECIQRAIKTQCSHCDKLGAGLPCYNPRCSLIYHVPCAIEIGCMFFTDRGMYCPSHQPRDTHPMQLPSLTVSRKVYLTRDESAQVATVIQDESRAYRVRVGSVILHSIGQLLPHQIENESFHTRKYIYPVQFSSSRIYWSMRRPGQRALYHCQILEHNNAPLFQVTVVDKGLPNIVLQNDSCNNLWCEILQKIKTLRAENRLIQTFPEQLQGEDLFGLTEPQIVRAIESLPGVDNLIDYAFHFGRLQLIAGMPLAINPSGCARSEPNLRSYLQRKRAFVGQEKSPCKPSFRQLTNSGRPPPSLSGISDSLNWNRLSNMQGDVGAQKNSTLTSWCHQYRRLKTESQSNVVFGRSRIQGFGLFAAHDLEPNTIVIEYVGELIRLEMANKREKEYEARNRGIYMFRLEDDIVIDATMTGGPARYINHSCQPNCFTKYVNFDNEGHIVIITKRKVEKGEELTYDYQFDLEDCTSKIPCLCGAVGCRKWMN